MYLNLDGSNSVKVILVCVILGSAHKVPVFSSIELSKLTCTNFGLRYCDSQHLRL